MLRTALPSRIVRRWTSARRCVRHRHDGMVYSVWQHRKQKNWLRFQSVLFCGERGIRTPGTVKYAGFQDRCIRPLCHLSERYSLAALCVKSGAKVRLFVESSKFPHCFFVIWHKKAVPMMWWNSLLNRIWAVNCLCNPPSVVQIPEGMWPAIGSCNLTRFK